MMNYAATLEYMYAQLPMYQRVGPAAYKKDLHNTLALCAKLGNPQTAFPTLHIAGTNGKGSVTHLLASVLQAAGLKTGVYISPHYKDFRERIKINGQYIPKRCVQSFVHAHTELIEEIQPSFFELCVAMAFDYFRQEQVDIAVIEVGLGGRLDSTNVITPLVSVVTNISFDHVNLLGNTLPLIAGEKAGIIKPGIPVVIGETHPETAPVFREKARSTASSIVFADQHFEALEKSSMANGSTLFDIKKEGTIALPDMEIQAAGPFQSKNIATTLQALEVLNTVAKEKGLPQFHTTEAHWRTGLASVVNNTRFQGRWQVIGHAPMTLCDSAHNEAGVRAAFERILTMPYKRLHIVTGFVNDKDVSKVLQLYPAEATYYFAKANIPRGLDAHLLREQAADRQLHGKAYSSVKNALRAARRAAAPDDMIVVIGSIFVVAEVI